MNPYDNQSEDTINLFLQLNEFLSIELEIYDEEFIKNKEIKSYCDRIIMEYERVFEDKGTKRSNMK